MKFSPTADVPRLARLGPHLHAVHKHQRALRARLRHRCVHPAAHAGRQSPAQRHRAAPARRRRRPRRHFVCERARDLVRRLDHLRTKPRPPRAQPAQRPSAAQRRASAARPLQPRAARRRRRPQPGRAGGAPRSSRPTSCPGGLCTCASHPPSTPPPASKQQNQHTISSPCAATPAPRRARAAREGRRACSIPRAASASWIARPAGPRRPRKCTTRAHPSAKRFAA